MEDLQRENVKKVRDKDKKQREANKIHESCLLHSSIQKHQVNNRYLPLLESHPSLINLA